MCLLLSEETLRKAKTDHNGLFLLPLAAMWAFVPEFSAFYQMCGISISLFLIIKLHTWLAHRARCGSTRCRDTIAWFLAWPGLDTRSFFQVKDCDRPPMGAWLFTGTKVAFGAWLLFVAAPTMLPVHRLLSGWTALAGLLFMLHFGMFHGLALFWRGRGRDVRPIMNAPILSASVSEFWSKRWNLAFRDYAHRFVFSPLACRTTPAISLIIGYLVSGLLHELVISVPVRAGFGLPTLYFLIQALAILVERKLRRAGFGLTGGARGRMWTAIVTGPSACLMFHAPFVREVIVPMVESLPRLS